MQPYWDEQNHRAVMHRHDFYKLMSRMEKAGFLTDLHAIQLERTHHFRTGGHTTNTRTVTPLTPDAELWLLANL